MVVQTSSELASSLKHNIPVLSLLNADIISRCGVFLEAEVILNHSYCLLHDATHIEQLARNPLSESCNSVGSCGMGQTGGSLHLSSRFLLAA